MLRNLCKSLGQLSLTSVRSYSTTSLELQQKHLPIISTADYIEKKHFFVKPREAWIENLDSIEEKKLGLIKLHPEIFGATPRTDIIHENIKWQRMYKFIQYAHTKVRSETRFSKRKPWPQKGLGRARHGNRASPLFLHGAKAHGPRSHKSFFYMLPFYTRLHGLTSTLSVKLAQDDLHIVPNLDIPSEEPSYLEELVQKRNWGPSVLFVDVEDYFPEKISIATNEINHINMMPVYGLNVYSMLKHTTLVLTENAVRDIEKKILLNFNRVDIREQMKKFKPDQR